MLRLARMTDYAVVVLAAMVRDDRGELATTTWLARDTGVPEPSVAKILKHLVHAGIVRSQRGAAGGYRLNRDPAHISISEVISALEGPVALTACVDGAPGSCAVEHLCQIRGNWDHVNSAIEAALDRISLADMASAQGAPGRTAPRPGAAPIGASTAAIAAAAE